MDKHCPAEEEVVPCKQSSAVLKSRVKRRPWGIDCCRARDGRNALQPGSFRGQ